MPKRPDERQKHDDFIKIVHRYRGLVREYHNGALSINERKEMFELGRKIDVITSREIITSKSQQQIF